MVENKRDWSCPHGSRWIWWPGDDGKGEWMAVAVPMRSDAHCGPERMCQCIPPGSKRHGGLKAIGPELD